MRYLGSHNYHDFDSFAIFLCRSVVEFGNTTAKTTVNLHIFLRHAFVLATSSGGWSNLAGFRRFQVILPCLSEEMSVLCWKNGFEEKMELARIKVRCCLLVCGFEHAEFSGSKWIWLDGDGDILVFSFWHFCDLMNIYQMGGENAHQL